ncbi:MAG: 50S ribosomal protein L29 [Deltaproteobacteria bacterium]|nr:50S ribosomal protein L29 [Deltaproteobacteria bacterium]
MATKNELREKSGEELAQHEAELRKGIADAQYKHATRQLEDTASIRRQKRELAQLLTVKTEKARGITTTKKTEKK